MIGPAAVLCAPISLSDRAPFDRAKVFVGFLGDTGWDRPWKRLGPGPDLGLMSDQGVTPRGPRGTRCQLEADDALTQGS